MWKLIYSFVSQSEIFQAFIFSAFGNYILVKIKTRISASQVVRILHKINKTYFKQKCQASEKYVHF